MIIALLVIAATVAFALVLTFSILHARLFGPRGKGTLEIRAVRVGEEMRFNVLKFHGEGKVVDLLIASR
jgi:hypothetical protein